MFKHLCLWQQFINSFHSSWCLLWCSDDSSCWEKSFSSPWIIVDLNGFLQVNFVIDELIEWSYIYSKFGVILSFDPELSMDSINFEKHFVFSFEQNFRNNLCDNIFGLFKIQLEQVENSIKTVWIWDWWFIKVS